MIEVGDYIRTKKGLIAKVCAYQDLKIYDDKGKSAIFYSFDTDKGTIADVEIAKHSKNIINLLEVGDYLNGYLVTDIDKNNQMICLLMPFNEENQSNFNIVWNTKYSIKTILTKEQFKNAEYRIPEKK